MIITKEQVLETMQSLPEQFSLEELVEQLTAMEQGEPDLLDDMPAASIPTMETGKISSFRKRIQTPMTNEAIEEHLKNEKAFFDLFGSWETTLPADELVEEIRNARHFSRSIEDF